MAVWENWYLENLWCGDMVRAIRNSPYTNALKGELGVVFQEAHYHEPNTGPMVRFFGGGICNVYENDVEIVILHNNRISKE